MPADSPPWLARIHDKDGHLGSGILIAPGWLLTCAHVLDTEHKTAIDFCANRRHP